MARSKNKSGAAGAEPAATAGAATTPEAAAQDTPAPKAAAKAKAQPKASAEATPAPVVDGTQPKAKGEAKAKAKGEANAKAEPKAKADAKAKAEPKAEPKAKADAKAKAEPKAEAKSKAKAKAKAPAPAPVPEPVVEEEGEDGMKTVKKRRRKKAVEELGDEATEVPERKRSSGDDGLSEKALRAKFGGESHDGLADKLCQELKAMPKVDTSKPPDQVLKQIGEQETQLKKMLKDIDETLKSVKITRPKKGGENPSKIIEQMREMDKIANGTYEEETKQAMIKDQEAALTKAWAFQAYRKFEEQMSALKSRCETQLSELKEMRQTANDAKSAKSNLQRVAAAKNVKVEELGTDADVVSTTVEVGVEAVSLSSLYKQKFEKQFGVVIDKQDNKGKGKGKTPDTPVKTLIVRGLKEETAECVAVLKKMDLSCKKTIALDGKAAAIVLGPSHSHARKIEDTFPGVFLGSSERNTVTVYGNAKLVKTVEEHIAKIIADGVVPSAVDAPEDSDAKAGGKGEKGGKGSKGEGKGSNNTTMLLDKDLARALIGARGANVAKIEEDTSTKIKVLAIKDKDNEDAKAPVIISGDKENQLKAKDAVEQFLKTITIFLCEGDSEVVSRLYDNAIGRGKGKSGGKGSKGSGGAFSGAGTTFANLRDTSGLTVTRKPNGIMMVGPKADVEKWKSTLTECMADAAQTPVAVKLEHFEQLKMFDEKTLEGVCTKTGAKVSIRKGGKGGDISLEIIGTDTQTEAAKKELEAIIVRECFVDTIPGVSEDGVRALTAKGAEKLKEIEKKHEVSIGVDKQASTVKVVGTKENVASAKEAVDAVIVRAGNTTRKEIDIEWDEGRVVIGKSGATVKSIKQETGLDDLQVEDNGDRKKVILKGSAEAVASAEKMVQEALQASKDGKAVADEKWQKRNEEWKANEWKEDWNEGSKDGKAAAPKKKEKKEPAPKAPTIGSKELFPTLGPEGGAVAKKPAGGAWNKASGGADESAQDVKEAFPEL